jgi:hypothetical protein
LLNLDPDISTIYTLEFGIDSDPNPMHRKTERKSFGGLDFRIENKKIL